jgi:hypothetical protein
MRSVESETPRWVTTLLVFWCVLLLPWLPFALMSGMAFDAGYTMHAYVFFWSVWTYPVAIAIAAFLRRRMQLLALLPCVNVVAFLISGW